MNGTQRAATRRRSRGCSIDRASFDGKPPFNLPPRFAEARAKLDLSTPFNFVTTNDIIGGNSGSPMVNRAGELVGLIFDGNIESLVGRLRLRRHGQPRQSPCTAARSSHALRTVYDAGALADELDPPR